MGKWDRRYYSRPSRRYYRDYNWSPPRDEPCPDPETEVWQDNVPMWEKKFCYLVGRMPWKKVLSTRNFMHCNSNVLTWDDSAGNEAFTNAKKRFWDEFNGLPCGIQLPDPDMYNDEINWNPYIDPDLSRELDRVYFNPDDKYYLPSTSSPKENNEGSEKINDPWKRSYTQNSTVQDKATGWNTWDDSIDETSKMTKNNDPWESHHTQATEIKDNSWESHHTQATEIKDNSWGGAWNNSWDTKPKDTPKNWKVEASNSYGEGTRWQDRGGCSRNWNQNSGKSFNPSYQNNNYRAQESRVPNGRGNCWGQQRNDKFNHNNNVRGSGNGYRGRGRGRGLNPLGSRKREGPDYHADSCKGPRIQGGGYQSSRYWNEDNNKRVSFGGQWS